LAAAVHLSHLAAILFFLPLLLMVVAEAQIQGQTVLLVVPVVAGVQATILGRGGFISGGLVLLDKVTQAVARMIIAAQDVLLVAQAAVVVLVALVVAIQKARVRHLDLMA
jgi:hypothetical protein